MQFNNFVRRPFAVEALQITDANIEEVAKSVGTLKKKSNGKPYIKVDPRKVPHIKYVYPGFWMTRMGRNVRCYTKRIFEQEFVASNPELEAQIKAIDG